VKLLLSRGFSARCYDNYGCTALHAACRFSSAEVVQLLLETDPKAADVSSVKVLQSGGDSPLIICCKRGDEEAVKIATLLLDCRADVDAIGAYGLTPLICAAEHGRPELVALLLRRRAFVRCKDKDTDTVLHHVMKNALHGRDIIPLLCDAGADPMVIGAEDETPFDFAVQHSGVMAEALVPFLPAAFRPNRIRTCELDPIGSLVWCARLGAYSSRREFAEHWTRNKMPSWAFLRNGRRLLLDNSAHDVFGSLQRCRNVELWVWASSELPHQHPLTGDTVFHLLCRSDSLTTEEKLDVLADLRRHHRNPLTPNYRNELCVELTNDAELKKALQSYMCWQPERLVMEWFGPFFQQRAWALLLVCKRLKSEHPKRLAGLNRDIRYLLVKYASRLEHIYVPSKLK
jgi:hypothetical protein